MIFYDDIACDIPLCTLDDGVLELVGMLNSKGLITSLSCDGHGHSNAWVILESAQFKGYMKSNLKRMVNFLKAGETRWKLQINYFGLSKFKGIGVSRPRTNKLKRVVESEMTAIIVLDGPSVISGKKTRNMMALEKAVKKYL